jgi:hypothetical protein
LTKRFCLHLRTELSTESCERNQDSRNLCITLRKVDIDSGLESYKEALGQGYTPIADNDGSVVGARPEFYGILLFTLAGEGTLYTTRISAGSLSVTAYAVKTASAGLNIIVVNKDLTQNLQLTTQLPQGANSATLLAMTQFTSGATGPDLTAISGVTIQGASVNPDGTFTPLAPYTLSPDGTQLTCYVPALSAILIQIA